MVRYTLLRLLIFFGCLGALWLAGMRSHQMRPWLVIAAGLLSMVIAFFVLRPFREDAVHKIQDRVEHRVAAKSQRPSDEDIEDAATGDAEFR